MTRDLKNLRIVSRSQVTAGTILLLTASGTLGKIIAWFQNLWRRVKRQFSHAAVVLQHLDGSLWVYESTWPVVKRTPLADWLAGNGPQIYAATLNVSWTEQMNARALAFVTPFLGKVYNALSLPLMMLWEMFGKLTPPVPQVEGMVCSVLATATVESGLGVTSPDPRGVDPDGVPDLPFEGSLQQVA